MIAVDPLLGEVTGGGKEDDSDGQEEDEQSQFVETRVQRLTQNLESLGMAGQLEDAEDANEAHDAEDGEAAARAAPAPGAAPDQGDEIGRDGDDVDDVHGVAKVETSVGTGKEANTEFEAEPNDAARLERAEMIGRQTQGHGRRRLGAPDNRRNSCFFR